MRRRKFSSKFKTKVVLECLKERSTLAELAQKHQLQPMQISNWKKEFLSQASDVFEKKRSNKTEKNQERDQLLKTIGQLKVENDSLKDAFLQ